jgi:WhiB family redox-sensing transcriptional regulator
MGPRRANVGGVRTHSPFRQISDQVWREEAACRRADTDWFFPSGVSGRPLDHSQALALCRTCPVVEPCLEHALSWPEYQGVWGGKREEERDVLRRRRRQAS